MDPYLERHWNDVHGKLVPYIADALNELLPARYRATLQKCLIVADLELDEFGARFPDIAVQDWPDDQEGGLATAVHSQHLLVRAPETLNYSDPITEYSVEIVDADSGTRMVTAIEVLSPENKRSGSGMEQFKEKQKEYRKARVNRCDIDLLRAGRRLFEFSEQILKLHQRKPYYVTTYRANRPGEAELYAIDLRDRLPIIKIPLLPEDKDVSLDLQVLIDQVYHSGRFRMRYNEDCEPPLWGEDLAWATEILATRRKPAK